MLKITMDDAGQDFRLLRSYHVSPTHGFLLEKPLSALPAYFAAWERLCTRLPELLEKHQLRREVELLPLLDHRLLQHYREWRLAHLVLSFLTQGYVWQDGDKGVPQALPKNLAVPLYGVSEYLGVKPVISHLSVVLANWEIKDDSLPVEIDNMKTLFRLPGGDQFDWFCLVTAQVELDGVEGLKGICFCKQGISNQRADLVLRGMNMIEKSCTNMKFSLTRMKEKLTTEVFYNKMRPFLAGWAGDTSPLPNGLMYEGVNAKPLRLSGGSAAQSSLLQSFDAVLDITHEMKRQEFLDEMLGYMPEAHRNFIGSLKDLHMKEWVSQKENTELLTAYNKTVRAVTEIRSYHIQMVTKYIVIPSSKLRNRYDGVSKRGTGGQTLMPFLKSIRDTTKAAELPI